MRLDILLYNNFMAVRGTPSCMNLSPPPSKRYLPSPAHAHGLPPPLPSPRLRNLVTFEIVLAMATWTPSPALDPSLVPPAQ